MKTYEEQILQLNLPIQKKQRLLCDYCTMNAYDTLEKFLGIFSNKLDIMFKEGKLFEVAIALEHTEVLKILINYYEKTQLEGLDLESLEYKHSKHKLEMVMENALESYAVSDKILSLIKDYIPQEEETDTEDDLEDELADLSLQHDQLMHQEEQYDTNIIGSIDK